MQYMFPCIFQLYIVLLVAAQNTYGLFGWKREGGGVEGSRVVLTKNELILC